MFPLSKRKISGFIYSDIGLNGKMHGGTDYSGIDDGFPALLKMPFNGTIKRVGDQPNLAGKYIILEVPGAEIRLYHLSKIFCTSGQSVEEGENIGVCGATGLAVGVHLHLEVWINGKQTDPEAFNWNPKQSMKTQKVSYYGDPAVMEPVKTWFLDNGISLDISNYVFPQFETVQSTWQGSANPVPLVAIKNPEALAKGNMTVIVYDPTLYIPKPTNPVTTGNLCQIPWPPVASEQRTNIIIHEMLHQFCKNTGIPDTVHAHGDYNDPEPYGYADIVKQLIPHLGSEEVKVMTQEEVKHLYALAFYREPSADELTYWTGKVLNDFLKTAIADRAAFLSKEV